MPEKDPFVQTLIIGGLSSAFGALVRWYENVKVSGKFHFGWFVADMLISSVVGLGVFWLALDSFEQHLSMAACLAGLGGNVGSRAFDLGRMICSRRFNLPIDKEMK